MSLWWVSAPAVSLRCGAEVAREGWLVGEGRGMMIDVATRKIAHNSYASDRARPRVEAWRVRNHTDTIKLHV